MVGISNPTDNSTTMSQNKMFIAQVSTATPNSAWKFYLNYQGGTTSDTSSLNQFDLVITGTISPKFGIGFNATDQTRKYTSANVNWWGAALYLNWDPSSLFGLTLRSEYFDDKDNVVTPGKFHGIYFNRCISFGKTDFHARTQA